MGHLINPTALRVGWSLSWSDSWYSEFTYYPEFLHEVFKIRLFLNYFFSLKFLIKRSIILNSFEIFYKSGFLFVRIFYYDSKFYFRFLNYIKLFISSEEILKDDDLKTFDSTTNEVKNPSKKSIYTIELQNFYQEKLSKYRSFYLKCVKMWVNFLNKYKGIYLKYLHIWKSILSYSSNNSFLKSFYKIPAFIFNKNFTNKWKMWFFWKYFNGNIFFKFRKSVFFSKFFKLLYVKKRIKFLFSKFLKLKGCSLFFSKLNNIFSGYSLEKKNFSFFFYCFCKSPFKFEKSFFDRLLKFFFSEILKRVIFLRSFLKKTSLKNYSKFENKFLCLFRYNFFKKFYLNSNKSLYKNFYNFYVKVLFVFRIAVWRVRFFVGFSFYKKFLYSYKIFLEKIRKSFLEGNLSLDEFLKLKTHFLKKNISFCIMNGFSIFILEFLYKYVNIVFYKDFYSVGSFTYNSFLSKEFASSSKDLIISNEFFLKNKNYLKKIKFFCKNIGVPFFFFRFCFYKYFLNLGFFSRGLLVSRKILKILDLARLKIFYNLILFFFKLIPLKKYISKFWNIFYKKRVEAFCLLKKTFYVCKYIAKKNVIRKILVMLKKRIFNLSKYRLLYLKILRNKIKKLKKKVLKLKKLRIRRRLFLKNSFSLKKNFETPWDLLTFLRFFWVFKFKKIYKPFIKFLNRSTEFLDNNFENFYSSSFFIDFFKKFYKKLKFILFIRFLYKKIVKINLKPSFKFLYLRLISKLFIFSFFQFRKMVFLYKKGLYKKKKKPSVKNIYFLIRSKFFSLAKIVLKLKDGAIDFENVFLKNFVFRSQWLNGFFNYLKDFYSFDYFNNILNYNLPSFLKGGKSFCRIKAFLGKFHKIFMVRLYSVYISFYKIISVYLLLFQKFLKFVNFLNAEANSRFFFFKHFSFFSFFAYSTYGYVSKIFKSYLNLIFTSLASTLNIKTEIFYVANNSISANFLSSYICLKLKHGFKLNRIMNPIMQELDLLVQRKEKSNNLGSIFLKNCINFKFARLITPFYRSILKTFILKTFLIFKRLFFRFFNMNFTWFNSYMLWFSISFFKKFSSSKNILIGLSKSFMLKKYAFLFFFSYNFNLVFDNVSFFFYEVFLDFFIRNKSGNSIFFFFLFDDLFSNFNVIFNKFFKNGFEIKGFLALNFFFNRVLRYGFWQFNFDLVSRRRFFKKNFLKRFNSISSSSSYSIFGFKIHFRGRFSRKLRTSSTVYKQGSLPLNTFKAFIDYSFKTVPLRNSLVSVKVFLFKSSDLQGFFFKHF